MTFSLPTGLAVQFVARVPPRERSQYVAAALAEKLGERDRQLETACNLVGGDADLQALERDFDAMKDNIAEPWVNSVRNESDPSSR